jgi:DNA-directed RNA polymerase II subunit RPB2
MPDVAVHYDPTERIVHVTSDSGRVLTPVLMNDSWRRATSIEQCFREGSLLLLDKNEMESVYMPSSSDLFTPEDVKYPSYLLHLFALSYMGALIPFSNHNQSPRNIYQIGMCKQSFGAQQPAAIANQTELTLAYPQTPLSASVVQTFEPFFETPTGVNVLLAVMPFEGFNQEDSIIFNRQSIDRGLFQCFKRFVLLKCLDDGTVLFRNIVPAQHAARNSQFSLSKITLATGLVRVNSVVEKNDALVCAQRYNEHTRANEVDVQLAYTLEWPARVESVECFVNDKNEDNVRVTLVEMFGVQIGDKFASRHGQKGTVGQVFNSWDLPFDEHGVAPDILMNPLGIASRMTVGHLLEMENGARVAAASHDRYCHACVEYKAGRGERCVHDCLLSNNFSNSKHTNSFANTLFITEELVRNSRNTQLCDGRTGRMLDSTVFTGLVYYQRLRHMSRDKMYVTTDANLQPITRHPKIGGKCDGGFRFGVQERDCILSHGCAYTNRDRLFINSDYFKCRVCADCGYLYHGLDDQFRRCRRCRANDIREIELPFASKVLIQYLQIFNIDVKLLVHSTQKDKQLEGLLHQLSIEAPSVGDESLVELNQPLDRVDAPGPSTIERGKRLLVRPPKKPAHDL